MEYTKYDYIDCMISFDDITAKIYECSENGKVKVIFSEELKTRKFETYEKAVNWLYKIGFIFW